MAKTQEYFDFLEDLRLSGRTNMFGASPYLEKEFGLSPKKAKEVLVEWMKTYNEVESC